MKFQLLSKEERYGKCVGTFKIIEDGAPFDELEFAKVAEAAMGSAPFGYAVNRTPTHAYMTIYND